jgi:chromosomal replication initiator protein
MHRPPPLTLARFVRTPENRSALAAVQEVIAHVCARRPHRLANPLLLYGPPGTGKTHLVSGLAAEVVRQCPDLVVLALPANELIAVLSEEGEALGQETNLPIGPQQAKVPDLLIVEDLQHLPARAVEPLVQLFDVLHARHCPMVFTALHGPQLLPQLSARLASRLAGGLSVGLTALAAPSRLALLEDKAQRRQLAVSREVLAWLAEHLTGGGRQLEGALVRLETLARLSPRPLDVATVAGHFREQAEASRPTVERIAQRVGGYFRVEPRQLQSRRRSRQILVPRQVGMYLARQLTALSLEQIGAYFGGRDHSTVLHACRKVEQALNRDAALSGAVRQLHSDLA